MSHIFDSAASKHSANIGDSTSPNDIEFDLFDILLKEAERLKIDHSATHNIDSAITKTQTPEPAPMPAPESEKNTSQSPIAVMKCHQCAKSFKSERSLRMHIARTSEAELALPLEGAKRCKFTACCYAIATHKLRNNTVRCADHAKRQKVSSTAEYYCTAPECANNPNPAQYATSGMRYPTRCEQHKTSTDTRHAASIATVTQ